MKYTGTKNIAVMADGSVVADKDAADAQQGWNNESVKDIVILPAAA